LISLRWIANTYWYL